MQFWKYHAAGNDYLVMDAPTPASAWTVPQIRALCDRHEGIGSDGILAGDDHQPRWLRIFNPDGSEAERSGNGLRIFARYLWDQGRVGTEPFALHTRAGKVECQVLDGGRGVRVEMGHASFHSDTIPVAGPAREVLLEPITVEETQLTFSAVTVGNPHCVVLRDVVSAEETKRWGPCLEQDGRFPNRTNVQFVQVLDQESLRVEVWERGAGYTRSSGTSSCAAAAVAHRLGLVGPQVRVHMPGGVLQVEIRHDFQLVLTGPVVRIGCVHVDEDWLAEAAARITGP